MAHIKHRWTRRRFLSMAGVGAASTVLAPFLPTFEGMAQPRAKKLILFTTTNGAWLPEWRPDGVGNQASLTPSLLKGCTRPLEPYLDRILLLDGVDLESARTRAQGHPAMPTLWTGADIPFTGTDPGNSNDYGWPSGPSVDQIVGGRIGMTTPFRVLPVGVYPASARVATVSSFIGDDRPAPPQRSPRGLFDDVFSGVGPSEDDPARVAAAQQRLAVLDVVSGDIARLERNLTGSDREQLQRHVAAIEALKVRIDLSSESSAACEVPARPRGPLSGATDAAPEVAQLFMDLTAEALRCDRTHVVSFQLGNEGSAMGGRASWLGSHHEGWHNHDRTAVGARQYREVNEWYAQMYRAYLDSLDAVGVLDDCLVVWAHSISVGWNHTSRNSPVTLFQGRNLSYFNTGQYLRWGSFEFDGTFSGGGTARREAHGGEPMNKLLVSICRAMGLDDVDRVGASDIASGPLDPARVSR